MYNNARMTKKRKGTRSRNAKHSKPKISEEEMNKIYDELLDAEDKSWSDLSDAFKKYMEVLKGRPFYSVHSVPLFIHKMFKVFNNLQRARNNSLIVETVSIVNVTVHVEQKCNDMQLVLYRKYGLRNEFKYKQKMISHISELIHCRYKLVDYLLDVVSSTTNKKPETIKTNNMVQGNL